jgi:hypothetical protein
MSLYIHVITWWRFSHPCLRGGGVSIIRGIRTHMHIEKEGKEEERGKEKKKMTRL